MRINTILPPFGEQVDVGLRVQSCNLQPWELFGTVKLQNGLLQLGDSHCQFAGAPGHTHLLFRILPL